MGWWKVHHDSTRSPSWLYEEPVMALGGVRLGSVSNPSWHWEESATFGDWLLLLLVISYHDGLLAEQWWTPGRAITNFSQTHRSYFRFQKLKYKVKIRSKYFLTKTTIPKIVSVKCVRKSNFLTNESLKSLSLGVIALEKHNVYYSMALLIC